MKLDHLKRYRDIALLLVKFARADVVNSAAATEAVVVGGAEPERDVSTTPDAEALAHELERLGPTFVKLGQLLSTRPDILAPQYAAALTRLQDRCVPFPFEEVEALVEAELGVRISKAFGSFDRAPVAAASIAQVHRATMRDGRLVAVKVQRPDIRGRAVGDLDALADIARFVDANTEVGRQHRFSDFVQEFRQTLLRELDFREEAANLVRLRDNLARYERLVVPSPIPDFCSGAVLTMDFVSGRKVTALGPLARLELDGDALADELFHAYLQQMLADGFFHADPHPGNVFLTDDHKLALIDLGMVARLVPAMQERLLQLVLSIVDRRSDEAAKILLSIGDETEDADPAAFRRALGALIAQVEDARIRDIRFGRVVLEATRIATAHGIRLPPELALSGKALLNLDQIAHTLAPDFDPNAAIRRHAADVVEQRLANEFSIANLFEGAVESKNLLRRMPARLNAIMDRLAANEFEIKVDAIDETRLMEGMQKVANRIATGLVLAALIVGAALIIRVPSPWQILGYPALAIVLFLAAASGGLALLVSIVASDVRARRRR